MLWTLHLIKSLIWFNLNLPSCWLLSISSLCSLLLCPFLPFLSWINYFLLFCFISITGSLVVLLFTYILWLLQGFQCASLTYHRISLSNIPFHVQYEYITFPSFYPLCYFCHTFSFYRYYKLQYKWLVVYLCTANHLLSWLKIRK